MSKIQWTDKTWNPTTGCNKVSQGCKNCYAEKMHKRLMAIAPHKYTNPFADGVEIHEDELQKPLRWKKPCMIFVNSMSDLFHESVSFETIEQIYDMMHSNDQHIFIVLTKRPERMYKFWVWLLNKIAGVGIQDVSSTSTDNVWIGVTAENQEQANKRIPILLQIPAAKWFVSIEPMLGPVDLTAIRPSICETITQNVLSGFATNQTRSFREGLPILDWVICGGESGSKARPMNPVWVRSLRDQCASADVPFFFKQWGEWAPAFDIEDYHSYVNAKHWHYFDNQTSVCKVGRKAAGNLLDGEQHHNWPKINL